MSATLWPADPIDTDSDGIPDFPKYAGRALRQTNGVMIGHKTTARPLGARSGVAPGTPATTVTATPTDWTVAPHCGVIDGEVAAEAGPYLYAFDAAVTRPLTAADGSNPRIDLISVQVSDPSESDGSTAPAIAIVYSTGVAAASPNIPATPAHAFAIARINVPRATTGDPTVTWVAPYMAAAGGIIPVSTLNPYPASPYVGQYVDDASLGGLVRWNGSAWVGVGGDTGWVTTGVDPAGIGTSGANTISAIQMRRVGSLVQIGMVIALSPFYAAALSSGTTGNIGNTTVATITDARFVPTHAGPLGSGAVGLMLSGAVATDGSINVNALVPSITFAAGDQISVAGTYLAG